MTTSEERHTTMEEAVERRNELVSKVMKMWKDGMQKAAIARKLDIPESTVRNIIRDQPIN